MVVSAQSSPSADVPDIKPTTCLRVLPRSRTTGCPVREPGSSGKSPTDRLVVVAAIPAPLATFALLGAARGLFLDLALGLGVVTAAVLALRLDHGRRRTAKRARRTAKGARWTA